MQRCVGLDEVICHLDGDGAVLQNRACWHVAGDAFLFFVNGAGLAFVGARVAAEASGFVGLVFSPGVLVWTVAGDTGELVVALLEAAALCQAVGLETIGHLLGIGVHADHVCAGSMALSAECVELCSCCAPQ